VLPQRREVRLDEAATGELRHGQIVERDPKPVLARPRERQQRLPLLLRVEIAEALLLGAVLAVEPLAPHRIEQVGDDAHDGRDVVAPPISSGSSIPRRSISRATSTIWSSDGVISPDRPTTSAPSSTAVSRTRSAGTMTPRSTTS